MSRPVKRQSLAAKQRRWVDNWLGRTKSERPPPRELTYIERKIRRERILNTGLTPADAVAVHCSGDPAAWTAHWFNIPVSRVNALQASGNEGKPWTTSQKAHLSRTLGGSELPQEPPENTGEKAPYQAPRMDDAYE